MEGLGPIADSCFPLRAFCDPTSSVRPGDPRTIGLIGNRVRDRARGGELDDRSLNSQFSVPRVRDVIGITEKERLGSKVGASVLLLVGDCTNVTQTKSVWADFDSTRVEDDLMSGCPVKPAIPSPPPTATGGPFYDCGMGPTGFRSPSPTTLPHGFGDRGALDKSTTCIMPFEAESWWRGNGQPILPDVQIPDSDRIIHNSAVFEGDVVFTGERVQWKSQPGFGAVKGEYVCAPSAWMIEVDGVCICPVPEPGLLSALAVGLVGLAFGARRRRPRSHSAVATRVPGADQGIG